MSLLHLINNYAPSEEEKVFVKPFQDLILSGGRYLYRDHLVPGHITGSALLLSNDRTRVLMNHHKSLNKWLCFGGHADGEADILEVARREVVEESGIEDIEVISTTVFDLDIHPIPSNHRKGEPDHLHYDIRYVFVARDEAFKISDESLNLKWCGIDEASGLSSSSGMKRLLMKARHLS